MIKIDNIPVVGKFLLIIAVFGLSSLASVAYSTHGMRHIDDGYSAAIDGKVVGAVELARSTRAMNQIPLAIADLVLANTDDGNRLAADNLKTARADFLDHATKAKQLLPNQAAAIDGIIGRLVAATDQVCAKTMTLGAAPGPEAVKAAGAEFLDVCRPAFRPLTTQMTKYVGDALAELNTVNNELRDVTDNTIRMTYISVLCGIVLVTGLAYFAMSAWISRPLKGLGAQMRTLASGDLSLAVVGAQRKDELGPMAQALQVFKDNGLKLKQTEADAARARQSADQERSANEATRLEIQQRQEAVMAAIANGLDLLSKGDLTGRLNQAFSSEYEKLRADFNETAKSLQSALGTISSATNGISSGSEQIAHASDDLARRTEQQAASLEETAASLNFITDTVKTMAANAGQAADIVLSTRTSAESSGEIVQQAVEAMSKIQESSKQIGNIIGVIDEIAFQTNLLALNAGVEAARAGEAGRGFAVVASEVRALAQRSAEAAKQIKGLITASSSQVESGVVLVDKTGVALRDIIGKVTEMDQLVRDISSASKEQSTSIAEINIAVKQMDQVVQQNAAMVEESTAAAHALKNETQDLSTMVGRFQLGDGHPRAAEATHARPASFAKTTAKPRPMMKTTSAAKAAPSADDWQEF